MVPLSRPACLFRLLVATLIAPAFAFCQQTSITEVTATPTIATFGHAVSLSATVAGQTNSIPIPSTSVSFFDGSTNLGSATLSGLAVVAPQVVPFAQMFGSIDTTSQGTLLWGDVN